MTLQRRPAPDARTFIGEGKAEEVKQLAEMNDCKSDACSTTSCRRRR